MSEFGESFLLALEEQRRSAGMLAKQERYLALLDPQPGQQVLDLGSGSGAFCRLLAPLVAPTGRVVGVDRSADAVAVARRLADGRAPGLLSFERADGHALPYPDGAFDTATCISVLAFCDDPARVLGELRRVLRPGGRLLVANSDEDTRIYNSRDRELGRQVLRAIADRARDPWIGRRLLGMLTHAGLQVAHEAVTTGIEREFAPGVAGYIFAHAWREQILQSGIAPEEYERWLADLAACARDGSYCYSATTYTYLVDR